MSKSLKSEQERVKNFESELKAKQAEEERTALMLRENQENYARMNSQNSQINADVREKQVLHEKLLEEIEE